MVSLQERFARGVQPWLMSRGGATTAAASVAELLGGRDAERVLADVRNSFVYVPADRVYQEDMFQNKPNPELALHTEKGTLGQVDAFLSHSWHDDPVGKRLQKWRVQFKKENNGREPRL